MVLLLLALPSPAASQALGSELSSSVDSVVMLPPSPVDLVNQGACTPRPRVDVKSEKIGEKDFRVTITAGRGNIELIRFGNAPTARVDLPVPSPQSGSGLVPPFEYKPAPPVSTYTFVVHSTGAGTAVTLPITVFDGCGLNFPWETFVGGGQAATQVQASIADPAPIIEGTTNLTFTVTLSAPASVPVAIQYTTVDGTATAPADYITKTDTLTFAVGEMSKTIDVSIVGDPLDEPTETFTVQLTGATGATITDATATGTITDNDTPPTGADDSYVAIAGQTLTVGAGAGPPPGLLVNDQAGTSTPQIVSFGGLNAGGSVTSNAAGATATLTPGGSLTVNANGSFSFLAPTGFTGSFQFRYRAQSSAGQTEATVTIDVRQAPVANDDSGFATAPATPLSLPAGTLFNANGTGGVADVLGVPPGAITKFGGGTLGGSVDDNNAGATSNVGGHSLTVNADGSFSFTSAAGFTGPFTFLYRLANSAGSDTATVTIDVRSSPNAQDDALAVTIGGPALTGNLNADNGSGADNLGIPAGTLTSIGGGSLPGTVTQFPTPASQPLAGGTLTVAADGTIGLTGANTPGTYTFQYRLTNAAGTDDATVTITVRQVPTAVADPNYTTAPNTPLTVPAATGLLANDNRGFPLAVVTFFGSGSLGGTVDSNSAGPTPVTFGTGGSLQVSADGSFAFTPATGFTGTFTFEYRLANAAGSTTATVTIDVEAAPTAQPDAFAVTVGGAALSGNVTANNGSGADSLGAPAATVTSIGGGSLGGSVISNPTPASVSLAGGTLQVAADGTISLTGANVQGTYTFQYRLTNPVNTSDATVTITVDAAPTVISTIPADLSPSVSVATDITINFSESVNASASAFSIQCPVGSPVTFTSTPALPGTNSSFVLNPTADLPNSIVCTVTVTATQVTDADTLDPPNAMAADHVFTFTTQPPDTAPAVQLPITPANGVTQVAVDTNVVITFDEAVTLDPNAFALECPVGSPVTFGVTGSGTNTITLNPTSNLPENVTCTVTMNATLVHDADANDPPDNPTANLTSTFTTDAGPTVTTTNPSAGATVAVDTNITINFSEPIDASGSSFTIECPAPGNLQAFTIVGPSTNTTSITLNPDADLPQGVTCTVTSVAAQIADTDGGDPPNNLPTNHTFTFTTDVAPDVQGITPLTGATQVATATNVVVTFTEPVNVTASAFTLECPVATPIAFTLSPAAPGPSTSFTLDPNTDLPENVTCTVTVVAAQVTDDDAFDPPNVMATNEVSTFTTDAAPTVQTTSPLDNATGVAANANIVITFTESVNADTDSFTIECPAPGNLQSYVVTGSGSNVITLNPTSDLPAGNICTVTVIATEITDTDGGDPPNTMVTNYVFDFTIPPQANNDSYSASGNMAIVHPVATGVLTNDVPNDGSAVVSHVNTLTTNVGNPTATSLGGSVTLAADGSFTYDPPAGASTGNDTFTYRITKNSVASTDATVTIAISNIMWFVCDGCSSTNAGTLLNPYTSTGSLSTAQGTSNGPADNERIFIGSGTYSGAADTLSLRAGQKVYGQGISATAAAEADAGADTGFTPNANTHSSLTTTFAADTRPSIEPSAGHGVDLDSGNFLSHFNVGNVSATPAGNSKITGTSFGTLTVGNMALSGTGQALNLTTGTLSGSFESTSSTSGTNNVKLTSVAGTFGLGSGALSGASGPALLIGDGGTTANAGGTVTLTYSGTITGSGGPAVDIQDRPSGGGTGNVTLSGNITGAAGENTIVLDDNAAGTISFSGAVAASSTTATAINLTDNSGVTITFTGGLDIDTTTGIGFNASGGGTVNVSGSSNSITSTQGKALDVDNMTATMTFATLSSTNSASQGIDLTNLAASSSLIVQTSTTVTNPGGSGINVDTVGISSTLSFGTTAISGSGNTAVLLDNSSSPITFGDLDISALDAGVRAFHATENSGTITTATGSSITGVSNATALEITKASGTTPLSMTFREVNANGGTNGIVLTRTSGTFAVAGTGSAGTGGTIQNTSNDGVSLTSAQNVSLSWMNFTNIADNVTNAAVCHFELATGCAAAIDIQSSTNVDLDRLVIDGVDGVDGAGGGNPAGQIGIAGHQVNGLSVTNTTIKNVGESDAESAVLMTDAAGIVFFQDVIITDPAEYGIRFYKSAGAELNLTLRRVTVQENLSSGVGEQGFSIRAVGSTTSKVLVDDSDFINTDGIGVDGQAIDSAILHLTVQASTFTENRALPMAVNFTTDNTSQGFVKVDGNTVTECATPADCSIAFDFDANRTSSLHGIITNNNVPNGAGIGTSMEFVVGDGATGRAEVRDNAFTVNGGEIGMTFHARSEGFGGTNGRLDVTFEGNTINGISTGGLFNPGVQFLAGSSTGTHDQDMCVNTATAAGAGNNTINGTNAGATTPRFEVAQRTGTTFILQGFTGTGTNQTDVANYFDSNNTSNLDPTFVRTGGTTPAVVQYTSGTCNTPTTPTTPTQPSP